MSKSIWNVCKNYIALTETISQAPILACLPAKIRRLLSRIDTGQNQELKEMKQTFSKIG